MFTAIKKGRIASGAIVAGAMVALAGCASADPTAPAENTSTGDQVIVGSFAFPESEILGEIYAQALEAGGIDVDKKLGIGPRQQTIPALQDGSINVIPEYNGNLLAYYNTEYEERTTEDIDAALVDAVDADDLQVLDSAPGEDKDAYVVTRETAESNDIAEIGDLQKLVPFTLGANSQFAELGYGVPGLKSVYKVGEGDGEITFQAIEDFGGPDTVSALTDGTVQVADIYTTSPAIVSEDLVVLEDPENLISAQNIIPLVAKNVYTDEMAEILNAISAELTTEDLIALRDRVEGDEQASAQTAAADWLAEKGLD